MLAPSDASRNRTLPGWQRWMLAPSRSIGCFEEPGVTRIGSDGCWPHRMLLGTHSHSAGSCLTRVFRTHLARPHALQAQCVTPAVFSALPRHAMCLRTHAGQVRRARAGVVFLHRYGLRAGYQLIRGFVATPAQKVSPMEHPSFQRQRAMRTARWQRFQRTHARLHGIRLFNMRRSSGQEAGRLESSLRQFLLRHAAGAAVQHAAS